MALNFSASFAACLAAGLKVPRQIMYCISQETPYVLYKDSQEADRNTLASSGQWNADMYHQNHQQQVSQSHNPATISPRDDQQQQRQQTQQQHDHHRNSPQQATSPFPQQQSNANPDNMEEDVTINQVNTLHPQQHQNVSQNGQQPSNQQSSPEQNIDILRLTEHNQQNSQQQQNNQQTSNTGQPSTGPQCFEGNQTELNYYRHPGQAMLGPPGFPPLHYLNKPLPGLSMEQAQAALDQYSIPDLLPGHNMHQASPSPASMKSKGSDLRLFKCLTCGKDFKQKSTLLQHERIHSDSRPYGCPECGKRFRQQSHLTQHLRIHANEKPFQCSVCVRSFRQRAILNQHLRIHSGAKPFGCPFTECGKHFRQKAILNQHVRTHQGEQHSYSPLHFYTVSLVDLIENFKLLKWKI